MKRLCLFLSICMASPALATPATSSAGDITELEVGWTSPNTRVQLGIPLFNPEACTWSDGYLTDPATAGNTLFSSTLLTAYIAHRKVQLTVDGCLLNRPRIIGVKVMP